MEKAYEVENEAEFEKAIKEIADDTKFILGNGDYFGDPIEIDHRDVQIMAANLEQVCFGHVVNGRQCSGLGLWGLIITDAYVDIASDLEPISRVWVSDCVLNRSDPSRGGNWTRLMLGNCRDSYIKNVLIVNDGITLHGCENPNLGCQGVMLSGVTVFGPHDYAGMRIDDGSGSMVPNVLKNSVIYNRTAPIRFANGGMMPTVIREDLKRQDRDSAIMATFLTGQSEESRNLLRTWFPGAGLEFVQWGVDNFTCRVPNVGWRSVTAPAEPQNGEWEGEAGDAAADPDLVRAGNVTRTGISIEVREGLMECPEINSQELATVRAVLDGWQTRLSQG